jgi:3-isopropylmalate/(R)-2-methylmalate dehydratase small subunit
MHPINVITSHAVPLDRPNVDTDQIIPKQFLKRIERTGYGDFLFYDWRRIQSGPDAGQPDQTFVLNKHHHKGAKILIAGKNFGCGSSREHAPWALTGFGFRAVVSTSFADIFRNNALKNGLLPVAVAPAAHAALLALLARAPATELSVDLEPQTLSWPGGAPVPFPIDAFAKACLLNGVDELGYILRFQDAIAAHERQEA